MFPSVQIIAEPQIKVKISDGGIVVKLEDSVSALNGILEEFNMKNYMISNFQQNIRIDEFTQTRKAFLAPLDLKISLVVSFFHKFFG